MAESKASEPRVSHEKSLFGETRSIWFGFFRFYQLLKVVTITAVIQVKTVRGPLGLPGEAATEGNVGTPKWRASCRTSGVQNLKARYL